MHRRGVLRVLVLLVLVVAGAVLQMVRGPAAPAPGAQPAPATATGPARKVLHALAAVERAYDAGDVRRLCRPGARVDPAVIRAENARSGRCESALEGLMANVPRLHVTVRGVAVRPDLATAAVLTARGTPTTVDLVRRRKRWLLSFSGGDDPMPALAGAI